MQTATQVKATSSPTQTPVGKTRQPVNAAPPVNEHVAPVNDEQPDNATRLGHSLGAISILPPDPPVQPKRATGVVSRLTAFNSPSQGKSTAIPGLPAGWTVRPSIQTKLTVGQPNDQYEQEADRVADQVMRMAEPRVQAKCACGGEAGPDGECAACKAKRLAVQSQVQTKAQEDEEVVQTKSDNTADDATPELESRLDSSRGSGTALPDETRSSMESAFGVDFGRVRVHTGNEAVQMNRELSARAFTHGSDIYFNAGKYEPGSVEGKGLLAHELTHVVQQVGGVHRARLVQRAPENKDEKAKPVLPSTDELTTRIANCIGIWETNRGKNAPAPKESGLETMAGVHASMATIEQATMPYAITALRGHKELRDKATPPLTTKELNDAEARCIAVPKLLTLVSDASAKNTKPDDFIKDNAVAISATGLGTDDIKTMFSAVTLKGKLDTSLADVEAKLKANQKEVEGQIKKLKDTIEQEKDAAKTKELKEKFAEAEKSKGDIDKALKSRDEKVKRAIATIPETERLGLGESSLRTYINRPGVWGENTAGWQRKAVNAMPDNVGARIQAIAVSESGTALAIPVVKARVNDQLAKQPVPTEEEIVKTVAQQNNPGEKDYGENVWATYQRLYPPPQASNQTPQDSGKTTIQPSLILQRRARESTTPSTQSMMRLWGHTGKAFLKAYESGSTADRTLQRLSQPIVTPAPARAISIRDFITLVEVEEARWPVTEQTQTALMISRLRKIFYGTSGWDKYLIPGASRVSSGYNISEEETGRENLSLPGFDADIVRSRQVVRGASGASPAIASQQEVRLEDGTFDDIGHVFAGLDAANHPASISAGFGIASVADNKAAVTWTGDLGSAVTEIMFKVMNAGAPAAVRDAQSIVNEYASAQDMLGDIDAYVIAAQYNITNPGGRKVSELLRAYYLNAPSTSDGRAREHRYSRFCALTGLTGWTGSDFANAAAWLDRWTPEVAGAAALYFGANTSGILAIPGRAGAISAMQRRIRPVARLLLKNFLSALKTRVVAEPP